MVKGRDFSIFHFISFSSSAFFDGIDSNSKRAVLTLTSGMLREAYTLLLPAMVFIAFLKSSGSVIFASVNEGFIHPLESKDFISLTLYSFPFFSSSA